MIACITFTVMRERGRPARTGGSAVKALRLVLFLCLYSSRHRLVQCLQRAEGLGQVSWQ